MKPGDILLVQPKDADDPEALAHAGRRCRLVRSAEGQSGTRLAFVQFSTQGRRVCLREDDLIPQATEPSATLPENAAPAGLQTLKDIEVQS